MRVEVSKIECQSFELNSEGKKLLREKYQKMG